MSGNFGNLSTIAVLNLFIFRAWIQFEEELEREVAARAAQEEPATASNEEIFL